MVNTTNNNKTKTNLYNEKLKAPYTIFIENKDEKRTISPIIIAREFAKANIIGINNFRKTARFRIELGFVNLRDANKFIQEQP